MRVSWCRPLSTCVFSVCACVSARDVLVNVKCSTLHRGLVKRDVGLVTNAKKVANVNDGRVKRQQAVALQRATVTYELIERSLNLSKEIQSALPIEKLDQDKRMSFCDASANAVKASWNWIAGFSRVFVLGKRFDKTIKLVYVCMCNSYQMLR